MICVSAVVAISLWHSSRWWIQSRRHPSIIEIASNLFVLTLPTGRKISMPMSEVNDVHASKPWHMIGMKGRTSSLVIFAWGRRFRLLRYRDYIEVRWLARQIRAAMGRAEDHPSEPLVRVGIDQQEVGDPQIAWSGPLPAVTDALQAAVPKSKFLGQTLSREYDNLGCAPGILLLLSVVIGADIILHLLDVLIICLQFGIDAYFRKGLRPIPHRGFFNLNNGQMAAGGVAHEWWTLGIIRSGGLEPFGADVA
jgi:hypothetical protein